MALISQQIPNLIGGISQQPDVFRRSSQCSDALNTYNDPVSGVKKRPGSQHIADISDTVPVYYGGIERDEKEKYIFSADPAGVRVWDVEGTERTVNVQGDLSYLSGTTRYRHLNIADTTFIVNPTIKVAMSDELTPESNASGLIFFRAIDYGVKYTVEITGDNGSGGTFSETATYESPSSGNLLLNAVPTSIASQLSSDQNITATANGTVVKFDVPSEYSLNVFTSRGDDYITAIPGVIENFGDLPASCFDGVIVKVSQNPTTDADDYYVRFEGEGAGVWVETVAPGIPYKLDPATMPHTLVREDNGEFTFKPFDWVGRDAGDVLSNPDPSFVGSTLNNILFERSRLGLLSDVNCILSESSGLSNFFRTTVSTIVDSDVIDLSASGRQIDILKTSISVKDGVLLFSDDSQFLLNIGDADILSPETATITSISSYQSDTRAEPARVGDSIMFTTRRDNKSGVREYFYQSGRDFTQSASITNHVPELLPQNINGISGSSTENIVFFRAIGSPFLYAYQFLFSGDEKVVSAWSKWRFSGSVIRFSIVFDDYLYVILERSNRLSLERVPLSNSFIQVPLPGEICLDEYSRTEDASKAIEGPNTRITLDRVFNNATPLLVSLSDRPEDDIFKGDILTPLSISETLTGTEVVLEGNWLNSDFLMGTQFAFFYEFSYPYISLGNGDVEIEGRLQIRNVTVLLDKTGDCSFRVIYRQANDSSEVVFIEDVLDWAAIEDMSSLATLDGEALGGEVYELSRAFPDSDLKTRLNLVSYSYRVPIMCENTGYKLRIESNGWQPVNISKAQWEGLYHKRSRLTGG